MTSIEQRFWSKVEKTETCWLWTAARSNGGYGRFQTGTNKKSKTVLAHRFAFELTGNSIPEGLTLDHLCRTPACVNPDHLEPVTDTENVRRAVPYWPVLTHCHRGHEFTEGSYVVHSGSRHCRECARIRMMAFRARRVTARKL